jgi:hypothetical protein
MGRNEPEKTLFRENGSGYKYSLVDTKPQRIAINDPDVAKACVANLIEVRSGEKM